MNSRLMSIDSNLDICVYTNDKNGIGFKDDVGFWVVLYDKKSRRICEIILEKRYIKFWRILNRIMSSTYIDENSRESFYKKINSYNGYMDADVWGLIESIWERGEEYW